MPGTVYKRRGDSSADHASFVGAPREMTVDTTLNQLRVHDGEKQGGVLIAREDLNAIETAVGWRNRVINGGCQIAQRGSVVVNNAQVFYGGPDRFQFSNSLNNTAVFTMSQENMTFSGEVKNSCRITVNTPPTGPSSGYTTLCYRIEGYDCFDLIGSKIALSFLFNSNIGGEYSVSVRLGYLANPSYVFKFSVLASTPTRITKLIPALPGSVYMGNDNLEGMSLVIAATGSPTFSSLVLDEWMPANIHHWTSAVDWTTSAANFIELSDLQLEPGEVCTPFLRNPYPLDLALAQRYYEVGAPDNGLLFSGPVTSGEEYVAALRFKQRKRVAPSVFLYDSGTVAGFSAAVGSIDGLSNDGFNETRVATSTVSSGRYSSGWAVEAEI